MHDIMDMAYRIYNKCQFAGSAHYKASGIATKKHTQLGVPVVILTTIVAASVFKSASTIQPESIILFATGFISLCAAVLSALQTFFKFSENAERHRSAGARYQALKRRIGIFIARYQSADSFDDNGATGVRES